MSDHSHVDHRVRGLACPIALLALSLLPSLVNADTPLRDPTRPPLHRVDPTSTEQAKATRAPLQLNAVFFAEGHRVAIVNGKRVATGDVVQDARVIAIERGRVVLVRDDARVELELVADVKRPSRESETAVKAISPETERRDAVEATPRVPAAPREGSPS